MSALAKVLGLPFSVIVMLSALKLSRMPENSLHLSMGLNSLISTSSPMLFCKCLSFFSVLPVPGCWLPECKHLEWNQPCPELRIMLCWHSRNPECSHLPACRCKLSDSSHCLLYILHIVDLHTVFFRNGSEQFFRTVFHRFAFWHSFTRSFLYSVVCCHINKKSGPEVHSTLVTILTI